MGIEPGVFTRGTIESDGPPGLTGRLSSFFLAYDLRVSVKEYSPSWIKRILGGKSRYTIVVEGDEEIVHEAIAKHFELENRGGIA